MNDRGVKDEAFVSNALKIAEHGDGRWIANQALFDGNPAQPIDPSVKASIVTSVAIYVQQYKWPEEHIKEALAINTRGDASALIDRLDPLIPRK